MKSIKRDRFGHLSGRWRQAGQSIIEVLIATGVVALVMTAVMAAMTLSLQNSAQAKYRSLATKLAQDGMENLRQFRTSLGWEAFYQILSDQGSGTYCLNSLPTNETQLASLESGACETYGISRGGVNFKRELMLDIVSSDKISLQITTTWVDGNRTHHSLIKQELQSWR